MVWDGLNAPDNIHDLWETQPGVFAALPDNMTVEEDEHGNPIVIDADPDQGNSNLHAACHVKKRMFTGSHPVGDYSAVVGDLLLELLLEPRLGLPVGCRRFGPHLRRLEELPGLGRVRTETHAALVIFELGGWLIGSHVEGIPLILEGGLR